MGRRRKTNTHLPKRLFLHGQQYRYAENERGKIRYVRLGLDEAAAVRAAERLNLMKRKERLQVLNAYRRACASMVEEILSRDGFKCVYCGATKDLGIDHLIPYSAGGSTEPFNIVTSCASCNSAKGKGDPRAFILEMTGFAPKVLTALIERVVATAKS